MSPDELWLSQGPGPWTGWIYLAGIGVGAVLFLVAAFG